MTKKALRLLLRQRRRSLSIDQQKHTAKKILTQCQKMPIFQTANNIALYLSSDGEVNLNPLIQWLWQLKKQCFLPIIDNKKQNTLIFQLYNQQTLLIKNRFGIFEPQFNQKKQCSPKLLDLVLLPLTGFDINKNRLGMGGGFYDKTFSFLTESNHNITLLGIAHECQKTPLIPIEPWDISVSSIITEQHIY